MIGSKAKKQILITITFFSIILLAISCGLLPTGPELTTKYLTFKFIVETDSCRYDSSYETGARYITPNESPYILKFRTQADDIGNMEVTNFSYTNNVYVNFKKTEGEKHFEKDYVIKPNEQILINMNQ